MLPSGRSLELLRKEGWRPWIVERWLPHTNIRKDLFGFGDILAYHTAPRRILIVQSTSLSNLPARASKSAGIAECKELLGIGVEVEIHGWHRQAGKWQCKRVSLRADDCEPVVIASAPRRRSKGKWQPRELF